MQSAAGDFLGALPSTARCPTFAPVLWTLTCANSSMAGKMVSETPYVLPSHVSVTNALADALLVSEPNSPGVSLEDEFNAS